MPTFVPSVESYGQTPVAGYTSEQLDAIALSSAKNEYYEAKKKHARHVFKYKKCKARREDSGKKAYPEDPSTSLLGTNCYGDWKNRKKWKDLLLARATKYFELLQEQDLMTDPLHSELAAVIDPGGSILTAPLTAVEINSLVEEADRDRKRRRGNRHRPIRRPRSGVQLKDIPLPRKNLTQARQVESQLAAVPDAPSAITDQEADVAIAAGDTGESSFLSSPFVIGAGALLAAGAAYYFVSRR